MRGPNALTTLPFDIVQQQEKYVTRSLPIPGVRPKKHIDSVKADIHHALGVPIQIGRRLGGGVSGSDVHEAVVQLTDTGPTNVILKHDADVGLAEHTGSLILRNYFRVPQVFTYGPDHAVIQKLDGRTLHEEVVDPLRESDTLLREFIKSHRSLWEQTEVDSPDQREIQGYAKKEASTILLALNSPLTLHGDRLVVDYLDNLLFVNDVKIGTMRDALNIMVARVKAQKVVALSHGDEGLRNCMITPDGAFMVDNGNVGLRSIYEPIAKALLWFEAAMSEASPQGAHFYIKRDGIHLDGQTALPAHINQSVFLMRNMLEADINSPEQKATAAAFMMMYLFRELQWLEKRGRTDMAPFVLTKAFSLAPALTNDGYEPFPLALNEKLPGYKSYPDSRRYLDYSVTQ